MSEAITLVLEPRVTRSWDEFRRRAPPCSIALDGYVAGPPAFDPAGPHLNLNHHEGVDRLATRSTAAQAMVAIKQGLFETFREGDRPRAILHVNDPDQDTSLAVWLLRNHPRLEQPRWDTLVTRLCFASDVLDATAGAYPIPTDSSFVREMNWIYQPYYEARGSGRLLTLDAAAMDAVIEAVGYRIDAYLRGEGGELDLGTEYDVLHRGRGWALVREHGPQARTRLFGEGIRAFAAVREREDGRWVYSLGRMSHFVDFPVAELYQLLNVAEGIPEEAADRWGGGDTIGGSPREGGSGLAPESLARLVDDYLRARRAPAGG